jgi:5-methylcytosine-specific restriction endonuclease McrA
LKIACLRALHRIEAGVFYAEDNMKKKITPYTGEILSHLEGFDPCTLAHPWAHIVVRNEQQEKYKKQPIPEPLKWEVWERDNFTCLHCGSRKDLSIDHIYPESRGGKTTLENCQTLCRNCNSKKGAR